MKQKLLLTLLLIFTIKSFSQDSKLSIEANFPIAIGDNFLEQNYNGLVDLGGKYKFSDSKTVDVGVSINFGFFQNTKSNATSLNQLFEVKIFPIQPRIYTEFNIPNLEKFHPHIGLGYSIVIYNADWVENRNADFPIDINDNEGGFNLNIGLSYDLNSRLFIQAQYDFIKIRVEDGIPDTSYNTNVNILKFGIGYRI
ncbi:outer membrane beta-barrel protein [Flavobacterium turcicum]|uniref:Outer membrane beta-barrel protein n=1 Tax=Flavobacterium turcicum TaxID=2764718 RepID=A0ABR7JEK3_9FLAO|nr:outer membrane beta-barrel protein [Flavobacterium turcicum]MBC5862937.1 outer membrane beta-barrel protein [Flavobacterium turcicum]NHL01669.1 porin family protein [Flavobacterium turcicum]